MKKMLVIVGALLPIVASAEELHFQCPERYLERVSELTEIPRGWQGAVAVVRPDLLVSGAGVIEGSPRLHPPAELQGSLRNAKQSWTETRHSFAPTDEIWAYCAYGLSGDVQLYRRVDGHGRNECTVRSLQRNPPEALKVEIACK